MSTDSRNSNEFSGFELTDAPSSSDEVLDTVFTIPNLISFIRLCMAPVYLVLLFHNQNLAAALLFAIAASTDFLDGQIARRTHTVSKLGQLLDPVVDRVLMITAVLGLVIVGRLPVWIVVLVLARDLLLLVGGAFLLKRYHVRVPVIYAGKFATTFLFIGFAGLLLNFPQIAGLGIVSVGWLPGFNSLSWSWGIWSVYVGLALGVYTTLYYCVKGFQGMRAAQKAGK